MLECVADVEAMTNVSFTVGVAEALEFEDGSFDVVTSSLTPHRLPEDLRGRALAEMARVLRPGGRLLVAGFRPPRNAMMRRVVGLVFGAAMQHNSIYDLRHPADGRGRRAAGDPGGTCR